MPPGPERDTALDIGAIKHRRAILDLAREEAVDQSVNVVRLDMGAEVTWSAITFVVCSAGAMALAVTIVAARRRFLIVKQSILLWPAVACAILVLLALLDGAQRPALAFGSVQLFLLLLAV